jgi:glutamate-5-semialdehyde dehydrogenase
VSQLVSLTEGQLIVFGGNRVTEVPADLAEAFVEGDRLVVVQHDGALLHIPAAEYAAVDRAVGTALDGFRRLASVSDAAISDFFDRFAALLADDDVFAPLAAANLADVDRARDLGRSTTRLLLSETMRADMVRGLHGWRDTPSGRDVLLDTIAHDGWSVEARRAPLGVVGFVFEGRPNVFADACGVVRTGNAVVFRIGSDALGTARAIVEYALAPALHGAGLPSGVVQLIDSPAHSAGHALFSDSRLSLAIARGSGDAVTQLGAVASQAGVPVSLHGTGGAWLVVGEHADADATRAAVVHSLDRKVCNTLNVVAVTRVRAEALVPVVLDGLSIAADRRRSNYRLHVVEGSESYVPRELFDRTIEIGRASGASSEQAATSLPVAGLATEWEWEDSPEITLIVVDDVGTAVELFNVYSPHFVASLISDDAAEQDEFYDAIDGPFVGDGFTRWVDGQYALDQPELGLANWQSGRMLGRGGILSGDGVHTIRYRAHITDTSTHR